MDRASKGVAWICIFSTLLMGCYTSKMIDPAGDNMVSIDTDAIRRVVMKDGTEYVLNEPPNIANDTLVGKAVYQDLSGTSRQRQVRLALSGVAKVSVSKLNSKLTIVGVVVVLGVIAGAVAFALDNMKLDFTR